MSVYKTEIYETPYWIIKGINDDMWTLKAKFNDGAKKELCFCKKEMESLAEIFKEIKL